MYFVVDVQILKKKIKFKLLNGTGNILRHTVDRRQGLKFKNRRTIHEGSLFAFVLKVTLRKKPTALSYYKLLGNRYLLNDETWLMVKVAARYLVPAK